jgi:hypothetical protein
MKEKQQTSLQWFNEQLIERQNSKGDSRSWDEIFEQANKMYQIEAIHLSNEMYALGLKHGKQISRGGFEGEDGPII